MLNVEKMSLPKPIVVPYPVFYPCESTLHPVTRKYIFAKLTPNFLKAFLSRHLSSPSRASKYNKGQEKLKAPKARDA